MWIDDLYVTQQSISFGNYLFSWKIKSPNRKSDIEIKNPLPRDRGTVLVSNTVKLGELGKVNSYPSGTESN